MVQIYDRPPARHFEEIARLDTSSQGSFSFTAQGKTDAVINRLKTEAAKLGANGVILQGIGDQASGSVGTGAGGTSFGGRPPARLAVGWPFMWVPRSLTHPNREGDGDRQ